MQVTHSIRVLAVIVAFVIAQVVADQTGKCQLRSRSRKIFRAARAGAQNSKNCFRPAKFLPQARAKLCNFPDTPIYAC